MTLSPDSEALMVAYVYGELSAEECALFERRLEGDAALRAEVDGLLATRDLLSTDLRFGEESSVDLPPPHLLDAILRAEPLARAPEIRDASFAVVPPAAPPPRVLQRLSTWLFGGGTVAAAAATLLLFARTGGEEAEAERLPQAALLDEKAGAEPSASAAGAPTAAPGAQAAARRPAAVVSQTATPQAPTAMPGREGRGAAEKDAARSDGAWDARALRSALPGARAKASGEEARTQGDVDLDTRGFGSASAAKPDANRKKEASGTTERYPAKKAKRAARHASRDQAPVPEPARSQNEAFDDAERGEAFASPAPRPVAEPTLGAGLSDEAEAEPMPAPAAAPEVFDAAPLEQKSALAGALRQAAPAPRAPVSSAFAEIEGPKPPPKGLVGKVLAPRASGRGGGGRAAMAGERQQAQAEAEMALASAARALAARRFPEALELFQQAALVDTRVRTLGAAPHVGQMQAYAAMGRHRECIAMWPLVERYARSAAERAMGALVVARAHEAVGQLDDARRMYTLAETEASTRAPARQALERLLARPAGDAAAGEATADAPPGSSE